MALIKQETLANGNQGDYWRITIINIDTILKKAEINYGLIKDKEFRDNNLDDLGYTIFIKADCLTLSGDEYLEAKQIMDSGQSTIGVYSYGKLKEKKFPDAIDG